MLKPVEVFPALPGLCTTLFDPRSVFTNGGQPSHGASSSTPRARVRRGRTHLIATSVCVFAYARHLQTGTKESACTLFSHLLRRQRSLSTRRTLLKVETSISKPRWLPSTTPLQTGTKECACTQLWGVFPPKDRRSSTFSTHEHNAFHALW